MSAHNPCGRHAHYNSLHVPVVYRGRGNGQTSAQPSSIGSFRFQKRGCRYPLSYRSPQIRDTLLMFMQCRCLRQERTRKPRQTFSSAYHGYAIPNRNSQTADCGRRRKPRRYGRETADNNAHNSDGYQISECSCVRARVSPCVCACHGESRNGGCRVSRNISRDTTNRIREAEDHRAPHARGALASSIPCIRLFSGQKKHV